MIKALNLPASEVNPQSVAFATARGAQAIVLWAPQWNVFEPTPGAKNATTFATTAANMRLFDHLPVYVAMSSEAPDWATEGAGTAPTDLSQHGPWAGYLRACFTQLHGAAGFIVQNEPNYAWPGEGPRSPLVTARQIKTAARVAADWRVRHVLVSAVGSDVDFQARTLRHLNGRLRKRIWQPPRNVKVSWAYHPYHDVTHGSFAQTRQTLRLLADRWHGGAHVWCTEGGFVYDTTEIVPNGGADGSNYAYSNLTVQQWTQLTNVVRHYREAERSGVKMWANYEYVDSLWGGWASGLVGHDGNPHPIHDVWENL